MTIRLPRRAALRVTIPFRVFQLRFTAALDAMVRGIANYVHDGAAQLLDRSLVRLEFSSSVLPSRCLRNLNFNSISLCLAAAAAVDFRLAFTFPVTLA